MNASMVNFTETLLSEDACILIPLCGSIHASKIYDITFMKMIEYKFHRDSQSHPGWLSRRSHVLVVVDAIDACFLAICSWRQGQSSVASTANSACTCC